MDDNTVTYKEGAKTICCCGSYNFNFSILTRRNIFAYDELTVKEWCEGRKILVVLGSGIYKLYFKSVHNYFNKYFKSDMFKIILIEDNDNTKNIETIINVCREARSFGLDRKGVMVAIGGGILMDIVGFASSIFRRKVDYIRIPTTLLGQIDAGIGIKTAVNLDKFKNLVGSFHPPIAVINDINFLTSLNKSEILAGLAEILKVAIVLDKKLFELIEQNYEALLNIRLPKNLELLERINEKAICLMLNELKNNFYENDLERIVDFGHTFSPYIEKSSEYTISHGIAVAMDMAISTELSYLLGKVSFQVRNRVLGLFLKLGLDIYNSRIYVPSLMWESLNEIILHRGLNLNLVIPQAIGRGCFIRDINNISQDLLKKVFVNLKKEQVLFNKLQQNFG